MWGERVTFAQILDAKEARRQAIRGLLSRFCLPIISVTTVSVGEIKLTKDACLCGERASDFITEHYGDKIEYSAFYYHNTGYEAYFAVNDSAESIKRVCVRYEEQDALGRLVDLDVSDLSNTQLSRLDLGYPERRCLLCDLPARQCYVNKTHTTAQLAKRIDELICQYKGE